MEKITQVYLENPSGRVLPANENPQPSLSGTEAVVEKALGSQRYLVALADGTKLTAIGLEAIERGAKVRVSSAPLAKRLEVEPQLEARRLDAQAWRAWLPVKWGHQTEEAKIEIYVQNEKTPLGARGETVAYLIFSMKTGHFGQIQWSVHLKGHHILIQLYTEKNGADPMDVYKMIGEFEDSLKKKGFSFLAPTVILKKPFKVPAGFQLNIRG